MTALSMDLRQRVMKAMRDGELPDAAARRFGVDPTTARRWRRQAAAGQHTPQKVGAKPVPTKLTPADLELLKRQIDADPGVTLRQLQAMLSVSVAESTVCRAVNRLGYRYKKSRWQPVSG